MTELSLNPKPALPTGSAFEASPEKPNKWKRPLIALLLTLLVPGIGQLYNRQLRKAVVVGLLLPAIYIPSGYLGGFHYFASFVALILSQVTAVIWIAADAFRTASHQSREGLPPWEFPMVWRVAALLLLLAPPAVASEGVLLDRVFRCRAYKIPSVSNCPTVCVGERMIADPSAFVGKTPERGALIIFQHGDEKGLWIKRVVGLAGGAVTQSKDGILVNGKPAELVDLTRICGDPPRPERAGYFPMQSKTVTVPAGSLYVIGDNWSESMDSRFEEFGFVSIKNIRGRPLFLYWSPYKDRIGCKLR